MERGLLAVKAAQPRRQFWLMPLMHCEELAVQEQALPLFERFSDPRTAEFARKHLGRLWKTQGIRARIGA